MFNEFQIVERPVHQFHFADNAAAVNGADGARVLRGIAIVAQSNILFGVEGPFLNHAFIHWLSNVGLIEELTVDVDLAVLDADSVAGDADDALDVVGFARDADQALEEGAFGVAGWHEDDHIAALGLANFVSQTVDDDVLAVLEGVVHAGAINFETAGDRVDGKEDDGGEDERFENFAEDRFGCRETRLGGQGRRVGG